MFTNIRSIFLFSAPNLFILKNQSNFHNLMKFARYMKSTVTASYSLHASARFRNNAERVPCYSLWVLGVAVTHWFVITNNMGQYIGTARVHRLHVLENWVPKGVQETIYGAVRYPETAFRDLHSISGEEAGNDENVIR